MGDYRYLRLTVRPSSIEAIWGDENSHEEIINPIPKARFEEFRESWRSLIVRVQTLSSTEFLRSSDELSDLLNKKSNLLSQMIGWDPLSFLTKLIIISDSGIPELPFEILPYKSGYLVDYVLIIRNVRRYGKQLGHKIAEQILYVKHSESKNILKYSLSREEVNLTKVLQKLKSPLLVLKDRTMRPTRFLEELLVSKYFIYCGHLDPANIPFSTEAPISSKEIAKMDLTQLKLVFLNGCSGFQTIDETFSLAQGFLTAGAEFIIGFSEPVKTVDAETASVLFWTKFIETRNIEIAYQACLNNWKANKSWNRFIFARMGHFQEKKIENFSRIKKALMWACILLLPFLGSKYVEFGSSNISSTFEKNVLVQESTFFKENQEKEKTIRKIKKNQGKSVKQNSYDAQIVKTQKSQVSSEEPPITKIDPSTSPIKKETFDEKSEPELSEMIEAVKDYTLKNNLRSFISERLDVEEKKYRILKTKEILSNYRGAREIRIEMMKYFGSSFETQ
jgi:hypothetical protein